MATSTTLAVVLALSGIGAAGKTVPDAERQDTPKRQVLAIYFHRTVRCPTCKRIGAMSEEAVTQGFENETRARAVEFHFIDFQDKKNAKLIKAYGIKSPTLVLMNVFQGETACWTSLPKVWQLCGKPKEFRAYLHHGVVRYLRQTKEEAVKECEQSREPKK